MCVFSSNDEKVIDAGSQIILRIASILYTIRNWYPSLCIVSAKHLNGIAEQARRSNFRTFGPANCHAGIGFFDNLRFAWRRENHSWYILISSFSSSGMNKHRASINWIRQHESWEGYAFVVQWPHIANKWHTACYATLPFLNCVCAMPTYYAFVSLAFMLYITSSTSHVRMVHSVFFPMRIVLN